VRVAERAWTEAVVSLDIDPQPRVRPNPLRWLGYAMWLPLPDRHRLWVLYDLTCATWIQRHLARLVTLALIPSSAIVVFLPAALDLRLTTAIGMSVLAIAFTVVWINEDSEHRLVQAGWPYQLGQTVRQRRADAQAMLRQLPRE
jgi:hypothetical protein